MLSYNEILMSCRYKVLKYLSFSPQSHPHAEVPNPDYADPLRIFRLQTHEYEPFRAG